MKKHRLLFFPAALLAILTILGGCKGDAPDCFKSTGEIIKEERSLSGYHGIHTLDNVHVILTADTSGKIYVEAGKHLLSKIKTEVVDGYIHISNENRCNWVRSYKKLIKIYIGIKYVKDIFHYGYGDIETEGYLNKDTLFVHHYSNGNIHLKLIGNSLWMDMDHLGTFTAEGSMKNLNATVLNLGQLHCEGLYSEIAYLQSKGQGNAYVRSSNILGVSISNEGDVYYYGNPPNLALTRTGSGNLIKAD